MAAPQQMTIHDMSGVFDLNKAQSDSTQALLKMQGIGWVVRQAAAYSNISITMKQYTDAEGRVRLDVEQASTGGIKSSEERILNWEVGEKDDRIWGKVKGRARIIKLGEVDCDAYLKEGWSSDDVVESDIDSVSDTWIVRQIWGFAEIEGQRKHVRRIFAKKGKEEHRIKLVYDYRS